MLTGAVINDGVLDEAYERLHRTGPELRGWLSNHGPMAADALVRLGHGAGVGRWLDGYSRRLEPSPQSHWPIEESDWRDPLGDPSRLGDWLALFTRLVHDQPWQQILARWWPRLLPGAVACSTHGLIRTGHAVRALLEQETVPRLDELAQALGYWAARWQLVPGAVPARGDLAVAAALDALPHVPMNEEWGTRARLAQLSQVPAWTSALSAHTPPMDADGVTGALDALTDAAVTRYLHWGHGDPVMLIHAATAPRAARLVLPALPTSLWHATYDAAWAVSAAITVAYSPSQSASTANCEADRDTLAAEELHEIAVTNQDAHVIKFAEIAEIATESHQRGNNSALVAGAHAAAMITVNW